MIWLREPLSHSLLSSGTDMTLPSLYRRRGICMWDCKGESVHSLAFWQSSKEKQRDSSTFTCPFFYSITYPLQLGKVSVFATSLSLLPTNKRNENSFPVGPHLSLFAPLPYVTVELLLWPHSLLSVGLWTHSPVGFTIALPVRPFKHKVKDKEREWIRLNLYRRGAKQRKREETPEEMN